MWFSRLHALSSFCPSPRPFIAAGLEKSCGAHMKRALAVKQLAVESGAKGDDGLARLLVFGFWCG